MISNQNNFRLIKQLVLTLAVFCSSFSLNTSFAQTCDCAYPIIFMHGYTGNQGTFSGLIDDTRFKNIWGARADIFHAVLNATTSTDIWGVDGIKGTSDDDVLVQFVNETNDLAPGCVYSINFENFWNENASNPLLEVNGGDSPGFTESDSNESSTYKQGYALGKMIDKVLQANPNKAKVILVGHSMGGLQAREYLQRQESNSPIWWVNPNQADGHQVAKLVTTTTPHLGSNLFGNAWPFLQDDEAEVRDPFPDLFSEATRDLRYSYAPNFSCGFLGLGSCPGAYLFGGNEDDLSGYWNVDVNCDGDENDVITGINIAGSGDAWDGTYDNPSMPLPTNLKYTWITSDVGSGGDLVVDLSRQWLYNGSTPYPTDGVSHRLADTILGNLNHLAIDDDPNVVIRALDESDYPIFAWNLTVNNGLAYAALAQVRPNNAPEGISTTDVDWFKFTVPADAIGDLCISITPGDLGGRMDFFENPSDYESMASNASDFVIFSANTTTNITLSASNYTPGVTYHLRVINNNVRSNSWMVPYKLDLKTLPFLAVDLLNFTATKKEKQVVLDWSTASEENNSHFELERATDGRNFEKIGTIQGAGTTVTTQYYQFLDTAPFTNHNYYRLKQVDFSGAFEYSDIVYVRFEQAGIQLHRTYPNPVQKQVFLEFSSGSTEPITLSLYNTIGQIVRQENYVPYLGENKLNFSLSTESAGFYLLELQQGLTIKNIKLLKK
ncbi:MAG: alpha/beta fold hydrolase [Saprospiraceae bacterium]